MKKLLLVGLMMLAGSAWAEWTKISENNDESAYIDYKTIRKDGNFRRVWTVSDLKYVADLEVRSFRAREEFDCKNETVRLLVLTGFSGQMLSNKNIFTYPEESAVSSIPPNSINDRKFKIVCSK
jgi:hypothetical protein